MPPRLSTTPKEQGGAVPGHLLTLEAGWEWLAAAIDGLASTVAARSRSERLPASFALGRVLAEPVVADRDFPATDITAMDGYALGPSGAAALAAGLSVEVDGVLAAGSDAAPPLGEACARRIMTGAPLPPGADRVLPFEATDRGRDRMRRTDSRTDAPLASRANVRARGEVARAGEVQLAPGRRLGPAELAVAASLGATHLWVKAPLRASIVVTGDEVVEPSATPRLSEVRDSHGAFLVAEFALAGIAVEHLGIVGDDPLSLEANLRRGLESDLLVITGGVSAGEFDFVEPVLARLEARVIFDGLAIQPGKPVVAAVVPRPAGDTIVLGLPGNPASAMVVWWLLGRALLRRCAGEPASPWQEASWVELAAPAPGAGSRDRFLPASLTVQSGRRVATPIPTKGSHDLFAYARADTLLRVRAGDSPRAAGAIIEGMDLRKA